MSDDDFYTRPILSVKDVELSVTYYCEKLGFERGWEFDKVIAQVGRNGLDIILDADSVIPRASAPSVISMSIGDLEALHRELEGRGANITSPPFEVDWQEGICQFDVEDPDGNVLVFWGDKQD